MSENEIKFQKFIQLEINLDNFINSLYHYHAYLAHFI